LVADVAPLGELAEAIPMWPWPEPAMLPLHPTARNAAIAADPNCLAHFVCMLSSVRRSDRRGEVNARVIR
jgi:hypothetical protein